VVSAGVRTVGWLTFLNVVGAALGVIYTVAVAYFFGTGRPAEVFLAAVSMHASLVSLTQTGQVSEVLLPTYLALRQQVGRDLAYRAYTALMNRLLGVLVLIAGFAWLLAPQLTALRVPGFSDRDIIVATGMFRWILPLVLLQVAAELLKTLGNAERLFGAPETVSVVARALSVGALALLANTFGTWALVVALWCAGVTEILGILWLLRRCNYRFRLTLSVPEEAGHIRVFGRLASTLPYVSVTQVFAFVLDAVLSQLPQGSFAVFRYATTIWSRTQGVFLRPIGIPFFTDFSESVARGRSFGASLAETALARVLAVSAIVSAGIIAGAPRALLGLWGSDRFPPEQVLKMVWLLGGLFMLLPLAGAAMMLRKVAVSLLRVREIYLALTAIQIFSAMLAWTLVPSLGLLGAFLTSAANLFGSCVASIIVLAYTEGAPRLRYPIGAAWRWLLAVIAGVTLGATLNHFLGDNGVHLVSVRVDDVINGMLIATGSILTTFGVSLLLGVHESTRLVRIIGSRIRAPRV
jgi:peptidoglycan biosynthesis protein MviN/MurJ (putative lipid II flippase)